MALTELETRLAQPVARYVYRTLLRARVALVHWTNDATYTNTWYADTARRVVEMEADGTGLTEVATLALCNTTAGSYYRDPSAARVYTHLGGSVSPYTQTLTAVVREALGNHYTEDADGVPYAPRLAAGPAVRVAVPARFGQTVARGGGSLTIYNSDGALDWLADAVPERVTIDLGVDL